MALFRRNPIRAIVLGVRTAEQTKVLATYNSSVYSLLVEYDDGFREILELSLKDMRPYLQLIPMWPEQ